MSNVHPMRGNESAVAATADEAEVVAAEFVLNHPEGSLRVQIGLAALAVGLVGALDWAAVYHVMALKFVDAMGQPIGSTAGLLAMASVTLVGYVLAGALLARPERMAKAAAFCVYLVVLALLAQAIAPAEIGNIREVYASVWGGGGGFGASTADEAPAWFVLPCIAALALAFSFFGVLLIVAEARLARLLVLRRLRARAVAALQDIAAARDAAEERCRLAAFIATLETPATQAAVCQAALRQGIEAYRAGVEARAAALKDALGDVRTPKAEKQRLGDLLAEAGACLKSLPATL